MTAEKQSLPEISGHLAAMQTQNLYQLGDRIRQHYGWKYDSEESVVKYLVERHHWLPRDVRAMSLDDLLLALEPLDFESRKKR